MKLAIKNMYVTPKKRTTREKEKEHLHVHCVIEQADKIEKKMVTNVWSTVWTSINNWSKRTNAVSGLLSLTCVD